jgi:DNA-binding GntR family transcriptional regulator
MKEHSNANKAFLEIRKKILSNQLPAHARLKEDEWAKKIGVSRMAVREALTRLLGEDYWVRKAVIISSLFCQRRCMKSEN